MSGTVAHARAEQLRCAAEIEKGNIQPGGAALGLHDWFAEEFLMTYPQIIGLAGAMGAGKDATAAILGEYGYKRLAFADNLRFECSVVLEYRRLPDDAPPAPELVVDAVLNADPSEVYAKPTTKRMRALLQWWGTEYRRAQDPEYWIKQMRTKLQATPRAAISDVRFANEAALVREFGGEVWRVERPGLAADGLAGHASEQVHLIEPDRIIDNSGTLDDLRRVVAAWVE